MSAFVRLNRTKQGKHVVGSRSYLPGRSILTDPDPQALLDGFAGTGQQIGERPVGSAGSKERVEFGRIIGQYVDPDTGSAQVTSRGIIVYDRHRTAHIIPARPRGFGP